MELTDRDVLTHIWVYPRKVFRFIHETGYTNYFYLLLIVSGIISTLQRKLDKGIEQNEVVSVFIMAILFGGLFGWLGTYIYASLISFTGKWLDGKAKTHRILRTLAYANIPFVCSIIVYIIQLYFIKYDTLNTSFSEGERDTIFYMFISINAILTLWTVVLSVVGIAEVQAFSIGKAILNLVLPWLMLAVPLGIIILLYLGLVR
jgi:hypothetical protein